MTLPVYSWPHLWSPLARRRLSSPARSTVSTAGCGVCARSTASLRFCARCSRWATRSTTARAAAAPSGSESTRRSRRSSRCALAGTAGVFGRLLLWSEKLFMSFDFCDFLLRMRTKRAHALIGWLTNHTRTHVRALHTPTLTAHRSHVARLNRNVTLRFGATRTVRAEAALSSTFSCATRCARSPRCSSRYGARARAHAASFARTFTFGSLSGVTLTSILCASSYTLTSISSS
eukprot:1160853-Pleurochrysis_carterae.AAC.1